MFAITEFSRRAQRVACLLMAGFVVFSSLSLGVYQAESLAHPGYSVTITQVQ